jgi:hypothetical protein
LFEIVKTSLYWNSLSETFIPHAVWEESKNLKYGIFEMIDADTVYEMMNDIFKKRMGLENSYLLEPFTFRFQLSFRTSFDPMVDEYKYKIAILNDKVKVVLNPLILADVMRFNQYLEGFSYSFDLKRFRPIIRIQTFIDLRNKQGGRLHPQLEDKRKAVVRDWFRMVLWFVRLRNAAKGKISYELFRVEQAIQKGAYSNGLAKIKQASIRNYVAYLGTDGEESSDLEEEEKQNQISDAKSVLGEEQLMDEAEMNRQYESLKVQMKSIKNLRRFLVGVQLLIKFEGLQLNVYAPTQLIYDKTRRMQPNFQLDVHDFGIFIFFPDDPTSLGLTPHINIRLKHIAMYNTCRPIFKREGSSVGKNYLDHFDDRISMTTFQRDTISRPNRPSRMEGESRMRFGQGGNLYDLRNDEVSYEKE